MSFNSFLFIFAMWAISNFTPYVDTCYCMNALSGCDFYHSANEFTKNPCNYHDTIISSEETSHFSIAHNTNL